MNMKPKVKIKLYKTLSSQRDKYNLECDPLVLPIYQNIIDSLYCMKRNVFFTNAEFKKYATDLADRIYTHLSAWNPNVDIIIKFKK